MQGVDWMKVKLLPHDPEWDAEFLRVKARIEEAWCGNVLDVQHCRADDMRQAHKSILMTAMPIPRPRWIS